MVRVAVLEHVVFVVQIVVDYVGLVFLLVCIFPSSCKHEWVPVNTICHPARSALMAAMVGFNTSVT